MTPYAYRAYIRYIALRPACTRCFANGMSREGSSQAEAFLDREKCPISAMFRVLQQATVQALESDDTQLLSCVRCVLRDAVQALKDATG